MRVAIDRGQTVLERVVECSVADDARLCDPLPRPSYTEASAGQDSLGGEYLVAGADALHSFDNLAWAILFRR